MLSWLPRFVQQTVVLGGKLGLRRRVFEEQRRQDELGVSEQRDGTEVLPHPGRARIVNIRRNLLRLGCAAKGGAVFSAVCGLKSGVTCSAELAGFVDSSGCRAPPRPFFGAPRGSPRRID